MKLRVLSPVEADRRYEAGETIPDGVVPDGQVDSLVAAGAVEAAPDSPDDRSARIQAAIGGLPDDARTKSGAPDLRALREASGLADLSAAERDREWRVHQRPDAAKAEGQHD